MASVVQELQLPPEGTVRLRSQTRRIVYVVQKEDDASCFVSGAMGTMLRAARLGGIAPLAFERKGSGWTVTLSHAWACYGYVVITVIVVATCTSLVADMLFPSEHSRTSTRSGCAVWTLDAASMLLLASTSVLAAPTHMRDMFRALNRVETINMELNNRRWPLYQDQENRKRQLMYLMLVVTLLLTVVDEIIAMWKSHETQKHVWVGLLYSFYYLLFWIVQLRELSLMMLTLHVMHCLRDINGQLTDILRELTIDKEIAPTVSLFNNSFMKTKRKLFKNTVQDNINYSMTKPGITKSPKYCTAVRRVTQAYARTCHVVRQLDEAQGAFLLMMLGSFLVHFVCAPYYLIIYMFRDSHLAQNPLRHVVVVGWQLLWCCYHPARLLVVIEPCHRTHMEMESTRELVSHLLRCPASAYDPLAVELDLFYKQLLLNQAAYSAMQAATLSRSLVATILGSITTYLVIILQLQ